MPARGGTIGLSIPLDGVLRARFVPAAAQPRPSSYAVTRRAKLPLVVREHDGFITVEGGGLTALIGVGPEGRVGRGGRAGGAVDAAGVGAVAAAAGSPRRALIVRSARTGQVIAESGRGFAWARRAGGWPPLGPTFAEAAARGDLARPQVTWSQELGLRTRVLGCGEKTGGLDKRGEVYGFWNQDVLVTAHPRYRFYPDADPLYISVPFALFLDEDGAAHGLFVDHPGACWFDIGASDERRFSCASLGDGLDLYFIDGPTLADVVRRYTALTGRTPLPPLWSLGYHQCRYSYESAAEVRRIARELRARQLPCDAVWLDIHYMDGFRAFTWDPKRFPEPKELIAELAAEGLRVVTIIDPGLKEERGYAPFDVGLRRDLFCKNPDGDLTRGRVWPGDCVFPDFTLPRAQSYWGKLHRELCALGVAGVWNDMNEPALGRQQPSRASIDDRHMRFDDFGRQSPATVVRNAYGSCMSRATYEGLRRARPLERPFVLTRAGYAGVQRYAACWTGDQESTWEHLVMHIPMLLNMGLSGLGFVGADVGGYLWDTEPELFIRWLQADCLTPFFRNHTHKHSRPQEPWRFGKEIEAAARVALALRYRLLPYLYTAFFECSRSGAPIVRPLAYHFPRDPAAVAVEDAFLCGRDLLVAPVLRKGARSRSVYLPEGTWRDFHSGELHRGGRRIRVAAPLSHLPLFVRSPAVVPTAASALHTGAVAMSALTLLLFADPGAVSYELYEDDGITLRHRRGEACLTAIRLDCDERSGRLRIAERRGLFTPNRDRWSIEIRGAAKVREVRAAASDADNEPYRRYTVRTGESPGRFVIPDQGDSVTVWWNGSASLTEKTA